ncbi:hypothetical protein QR680_010227 [Steinernema hermaphroditum]|uniref:Uncharacterized protein n=1 Tax=Steinernema hermaphroditum TaxID=289476 RepID=A0AA39MBC4_9BILA|nr:hypothetical protein QR680_010227 [Steinernema hermaphroditum]
MFVRIFVVAYNLSVFIIFLPLNIMIIWINMVIIFCVPITESLHSLTLAANRLFVMAGMSSFGRSFVYLILLIISWLFGTIAAVQTFLLIQGPKYNLQTYRYHADKYYSAEMKTARLILYLIALGLALVMYVVVILKIIFQRNKILSEDIKLFIQAVIPFFWLVLFAIVTQYQLITKLHMGELGDVIYTILGRSMPAVHCTVYMIFNRTLRTEVLILLRFRKQITFENTVKRISQNRSTTMYKS